MLQIGKTEDELLQLQKLAASEMMVIALDHAARSRATARIIPRQPARELKAEKEHVLAIASDITRKRMRARSHTMHARMLSAALSVHSEPPETHPDNQKLRRGAKKKAAFADPRAEWLTRSEAAAHVRLSVRQFDRERITGRFPPAGKGSRGRLLWRRADLDREMFSTTTPQTDDPIMALLDAN